MIRFTSNYRAIFFICVYILTSSCVMDKSDSRNIVIKNNSLQSIFTVLSPDDTMLGSGYYEEFIEGGNEVPPDFKFRFSEITPGSTDYQHDRPLSWDDYFEKTEDKNVRIYIVSQDLVRKNGWKKILNENIYTEKIKITINELDSLNWSIKYSEK